MDTTIRAAEQHLTCGKCDKKDPGSLRKNVSMKPNA